MKKILFLIISCTIPVYAFSQIGDMEWSKYWYYRHKLQTEFLIKGEVSNLCSDPENTSGVYGIPANSTFYKDSQKGKKYGGTMGRLI